jgi:hypothetical protein
VKVVPIPGACSGQAEVTFDRIILTGAQIEAIRAHATELDVSEESIVFALIYCGLEKKRGL